MPLLDVSGVTVNFPFEPYSCQVTYMEKVIKCLKENVNGLLESPTGTGKTLCLLCSSLAWQESRKAQVELNRQVNVGELMGERAQTMSSQGLQNLAKSLETSTGSSWGGSEFSVPKIIYASRTHSQLSQAVQELKRTAYKSVKVSVIGSRDQLCIHEQVRKEQNNTNKVHMCRAKVNSRTCYYYNHLEDLKQNSEPRILMGNVVDIEDLVGYGKKNKVCPYYMARELKSDADIIFMPYNYLLDPKTRKAHGVDLAGNIIIFDEAHNLEKICEDSASFDLKPGDIATAMEEITRVSEKLIDLCESERLGDGDHPDSAPAKLISATVSISDEGGAVWPNPVACNILTRDENLQLCEADFNLEDLMKMKTTLTDIEKEIDAVEVPNNGKGVTKPGKFMFELLSKASVVFDNKNIILDVLEKVVTYITTDATGAGAGITKGVGLTKMMDVLKKIFSQEVIPGESVSNHQEKLAKSYKVHIIQDDTGKKKKQLDLWTTSSAADKSGKVLSYWCFSPGHSMKDLLDQGIRCIILTSGTLSPLSSFSAEMKIPFPVTLENPHVIEKHQVWIGVLKKGPDGTALNSNYETRFTASYQASLGNAIVNFARIVPNGLLIFFPSYTVMEKCLDHWKEVNIWPRIEQYKQIFVEPKTKGVLNEVMEDFYSKINDPSLNGAIFIAVCRGKVSEGLDFSDINGRAVVITGLPYPPYLDPKVVLKMQYLDETKGKESFQSLSGKEWYKQQATRAVNQAIGRVIRHKEDFGAIMLCDTRFSNPDAVRQLPVWVRPYVTKYETFGQSLKDIMVFFKHAEKTMPAPKPPKHKSAGHNSGAYFIPTVTRSSSSSDHIEKAFSVQQHVPSLKHKHKDETVSVDGLKKQYQGNGPGLESASQKSLFAALDQTETNSSSDHGDTGSQIPSYQPCNMERKPQNKKKIVIKRAGSDSTVSGKESTSEVTPKMGMSHINTAENYLAEVKSLLSVDSYKLFSKALLEYKKQEDLLKVVAVLADLFTEDKQNHHLFAKFYRFVRPQHKKRFHELCLELTGLSTSYKPEDSVNKKRLREETGASKSDKCSKMSKIIGEEPCCSMLGKENSACNGVQHCDRVPSVLSFCESVKNEKTSDQNKTAESCDIKDKLDDNIKTDSQKDVGHKSDTSTQPAGIKFADLKTKSGYKCCSCQGEAQAPFRSNCNHICCMTCWRTVFEGDKLCPQCKLRVRRRHLTRLFFRSGVEIDSEVSKPS